MEHYFGIDYPHAVSPYGYTTALQYLYFTVTARIVYKHISRMYVHLRNTSSCRPYYFLDIALLDSIELGIVMPGAIRACRTDSQG